MGKPIGIFTATVGRSGVLAVLFVLCWSSGFVGAKLAGEHAAVTTTLMWRFLPVATVLLTLSMVKRRRRSGSGPGSWSGPAVRRHVVIGLLSQVGYLVTVYGAIQLGVSTGTTALIDGVQPLVAAALVGPLLGTAVTGRQWTGLVIGFVGVTLVTWADATSPSSRAPAWAYGVPLLGMLGLVASTFVERRTRADVSRLEVLTVHCAVSAVVFTAVALATGSAVPPTTTGFWVAQTWLTLFATFGGYGLYWVLVARIGVAPVNSLMFLIAPVTAVWGALMFGEPLTWVTLAGLALAMLAARTVAQDVGGDDPNGPQGSSDSARSGRTRVRAGASP